MIQKNTGFDKKLFYVLLNELFTIFNLALIYIFN